MSVTLPSHYYKIIQYKDNGNQVMQCSGCLTCLQKNARITCYDAALKESLLKVPPALIEKYTPESQKVTDELARRLPALIT